MASFGAARSALRSAGRSAAAGASKARPSSSPFGIPKQTQNLISRPSSLRSALETSRCLGSLLPFHSATASALLTSQLSVCNRIYSWNPENCIDDV